jgi:hypothetical protein
MDSNKFWYWSSTSVAGDSSYAWHVNLGNGGIGSYASSYDPEFDS